MIFNQPVFIIILINFAQTCPFLRNFSQLTDVAHGPTVVMAVFRCRSQTTDVVINLSWKKIDRLPSYHLGRGSIFS